MKNMSVSLAVSRRVAFLCCALALAWVGLAGPAGATALPIYKCMDKSLGIVYTDIPCKDGERLDVRAGDADPNAIARLEREREAWDRSAAQRLAEERRAMVEQRRFYNDAPTFLVQEGGGGGSYDWPDYAFFGGWGWGGGWDVANADRRRHGGFDGRDGRDGKKSGRFDRRHDRVVPTIPRVPQAHR